MKIYLSGPMSGVPDHNRPLFNATASALRARGHMVWNPGEQDDQPIIEASAGNREWAWQQFLRRDVKALVECEAVAVLSGWQASRGANVEVSLARSLGMPILDAYTLEPAEEESVLAEADRIVSGDRGNAYGHPYYDFQRTGRIWGAILGIPDVPPAKVGMCLVGVKISRECNKHKRDNPVDMGGYSKCVQMCADEQARLDSLAHHQGTKPQ